MVRKRAIWWLAVRSARPSPAMTVLPARLTTATKQRMRAITYPMIPCAIMPCFATEPRPVMPYSVAKLGPIHVPVNPAMSPATSVSARPAATVFAKWEKTATPVRTIVSRAAERGFAETTCANRASVKTACPAPRIVGGGRMAVHRRSSAVATSTVVASTLCHVAIQDARGASGCAVMCHPLRFAAEMVAARAAKIASIAK